ncbi:MAG: TldD/PmbA family protein [Gemmatimonadales bacterium]
MLSEIADALKASRAEFTEIRVERNWTTTVAFRGRRLEAARLGIDQGAFIRCYARGHGWGQVSTTDLDRLPAAVARAHELSLTVHTDSPPALTPIPPHQSEGPAELDDDPRRLSLAEKRAFAEQLNGELLGLDRRIAESQFAARDEVTELFLGNSDGTLVRDLRADCTLATVAVARDEGLVERAVDSWAARGGWPALAGFSEAIHALGGRAISRLGAPRVRPGRFPVILDPRAAGAFLHATLGHASEADGRAPLRIGERVGSELLSVGDDGRGAGLRGARNWDAEGTPTQSTTLLQRGVVVGRLHSRETAARTGESPTGNARASSFRHPPRVRMTNLFLASGQGTLADLLSGIPLGVYVADARGVQRDGDRVRIVAEAAWMIRRGELAEPIRDAVVRGTVAELLGAVDGVASDFHWNEGAAACARGCHGLIPVADGAPHLRLKVARVEGEGA